MEQPDERIRRLEGYYRPCACRSNTPFFTERRYDGASRREQIQSGRMVRTEFQLDRDKILYSRSFRRTALKAQVFHEHLGDNLRTRLDHSLEVAQIARHLARQLKLNEDLADAIGLAHDIGHTPFGHSGERALHRFLIEKELDGFKHNWQGLRVVERIDSSYPEHPGLKLTKAVRIGVLKHTKLSHGSSSTCTCDMQEDAEAQLEYKDRRTDVFEIQLCSLADDIGQIVHILEDALVSNLLSLETIIRKRDDFPLLRQCVGEIEKDYEKCQGEDSKLQKWSSLAEFDFSDRRQESLLLPRLRSKILYVLTRDIVEFAGPALDRWEAKNLGNGEDQEKIEKFNEFVRRKKRFPSLVRLNELQDDFDELKKKLEKLLLYSERVSRMDGKADYILKHILQVYLTKPLQVPQRVLDNYAEKRNSGESDIRTWQEEDLRKLENDPCFIRSVVDYVAGMTDRFALREYDQLYSAHPRVQL